MIVVHHLEASRSQRVLWALEELGVEYEVKKYLRDKETMLAPKELRDVHPLGKSPVVTDDGRTYAESAAILEHLLDKYGNGRLVPKAGTTEHDRYRYWMHYAEGSVMPALLLKLIFGRMQSGKGVPFLARPIVRAVGNKVCDTFVDKNLANHLDWIESELGKSTWFAGDELSMADIQMSFPVEAAVMRAGGDGKRPRMAAFVERIHARDAYKRAIEKGGPFEILS